MLSNLDKTSNILGSEMWKEHFSSLLSASKEDCGSLGNKYPAITHVLALTLTLQGGNWVREVLVHWGMVRMVVS